MRGEVGETGSGASKEEREEVGDDSGERSGSGGRATTEAAAYEG